MCSRQKPSPPSKAVRKLVSMRAVYPENFHPIGPVQKKWQAFFSFHEEPATCSDRSYELETLVSKPFDCLLKCFGQYQCVYAEFVSPHVGHFNCFLYNKCKINQTVPNVVFQMTESNSCGHCCVQQNIYFSKRS